MRTKNKKKFTKWCDNVLFACGWHNVANCYITHTVYKIHRSYCIIGD